METNNEKATFSVQLIGGDYDSIDDNVDVVVTLDSGLEYVGTFFTLKNVNTLLENYSKTGECSHGLYLWASDMILVRELSQDIFHRVIADLIENDELESSFSLRTDE